MSDHPAVAASREALTGLAATVLRLRNEYGDTLGVRRLTADVDRHRRGAGPPRRPPAGHRPGARDDEMILMPDDPYDESMWHDAQSETQHAQ